MAQGPNIYGELIRAQFENLASDPTPGVTGRVIWHTGDTRAKVDTGAAIKALAWADEIVVHTTVSEKEDTYAAYPAGTPSEWVALDTITLTAGTWLLWFTLHGRVTNMTLEWDQGSDVACGIGSASSTASAPDLSLIYSTRQVNTNAGAKSFPDINVTSEPVLVTPGGSTTYYLKCALGIEGGWSPGDTDEFETKNRLFAVRIA